ncbi:MAG: nucleotide exchange factor GrpE [Bacteroidales bacterium]|nr:nucleotide exchange factor GrpE [Bacteroidales bacterium]
MSTEEQKNAADEQEVKETAQNAEENVEAKVENAEASEEVKEGESNAEPMSEEDQLKAKLAEMNDKYVRLAAEYDNYRKRTIKEKADLIKGAGSDILVGLLPVMDDFERGLQHMTDAADVASLKEGVDIIYKKFSEFLTKKGVTEIPAKGEAFDADVHEAITTIPAPSEDLKGKVFDCVEKGYKMGDKVIRFAKVVVCQ